MFGNDEYINRIDVSKGPAYIRGITLAAALIAVLALLTCMVWAAAMSNVPSVPPGSSAALAAVNSTHPLSALALPSPVPAAVVVDRSPAKSSTSNVRPPSPPTSPFPVINTPRPPSPPSPVPTTTAKPTPPAVPSPSTRPTAIPTATPTSTPAPKTTTAIGQVALDGMTGPGMSITIGDKSAACDGSGFFRISGLPVGVPLAVTARSGPHALSTTVTLADVPVNNLGQFNIPLS